MSHECPARGCTKAVSDSMLMCRSHWYMVPHALRDDLWAAWADGRGAGTPEHRAAIREAVLAVDRKLAASNG